MARIEQSSKGSISLDGMQVQRLLECYQRGVRLATCEKDFDYAHAMFAECVAGDPGNLKFAEAMIQNLRARTPKETKPLFVFSRRTNRAFNKSLQSKKWSDVFRAGSESLKADPWNVATLRAMAEACEAQHYNEVELVYLKQALAAKPKDVAVNRHCARSLGRMGQFDQAIACWHRVETLRGKDEEATKMISVLAAEKLKYPKGRPPATQSQPTSVEQESPAESPRDVELSPRQKLEQAIAREPQDVGNYLELAELLLSADQFDAAEKLLNRAIATCGEQQTIVDQMQRVRHLRAQNEREAGKSPTTAKQSKAAPHGIPWLETALVFAMIVLIVQLVPAARSVVDMSQWSRSSWFLFSVLVFLGLLAVRFGPDLRETFHRTGPAGLSVRRGKGKPTRL